MSHVVEIKTTHKGGTSNGALFKRIGPLKCVMKSRQADKIETQSIFCSTVGHNEEAGKRKNRERAAPRRQEDAKKVTEPDEKKKITACEMGMKVSGMPRRVGEEEGVKEG